QPLLAKLLARRLPDPEPELGGQQGAPPCVTCRAGARTSKTWPVASWQFEMTAAPFLLNLCGTHAQEAPAAMVIVRRKWINGGWRLASPSSRISPPTPRAGLPAAPPHPNPTLELSGVYR